jgi:glycosyltransferase involved in cell wall biosynthesis
LFNLQFKICNYQFAIKTMPAKSPNNFLPEMPPTAAIPDALNRPLQQTSLTRVMHLINGEHYAGAERVQDLLAQCLPQFGFEVGFACVKPRQFAELRQSQNTPLYKLPMRNRLDMSVAVKIAQIVRQEKYGLIHAHTVRTAMVGSLAAKLASVPMVYHVHSPMSRNTERPWLNWTNGLVERFSLRGANRLIAVSDSLKRHMVRLGLDPSRIAVVHNGVASLYEIPFRTKPRTQWTLGTVALFRPRKGIEILLQSLAILRKQGLPVRLRAVGKFESVKYEREIRTLVNNLVLEDMVQWTGFTSDVTSELLAMDLFVLPSLFGEGLPMVVLEAMAAGVPVVATDVEGIPEAVRHGQDGAIAPAGDPKALAQAITDVIEGKYDWTELRQSAFERQAHHFSQSSMAEGVAGVYRQVLYK